jgi:hypothetical protein
MASSTVLENIKRTSQATLDALNAWDYPVLRACRSDDFIFQGLPPSLNLLPMNNEDFQNMFVNFLTPGLPNFKVCVNTKLACQS